MQSETQDQEADWRFIADTVMGGVSHGEIHTGKWGGRWATRLQGRVSLDNNGGFIQMATDLNADGSLCDLRDWQGLDIDVRGNGETYELRLRTDELEHPWQSYRVCFDTSDEWVTRRLPFADLEPHRTERAFNPARLCRLGVLAFGREFDADVAVAGLRWYR